MEATMGKVRNKKGLTLIELLAVVLIIGIIAAIAVPAVSNAIEKSKKNSDMSTQVLIKEAATRYALDNTIPAAGKTITLTNLQDAGYLNKVKFNNGIYTVNSISFSVVTGANTGDNIKITISGPGDGTNAFVDLTTTP